MFAVAREVPVVVHDNGDVLWDCVFTKHDVSHHRRHQQQQQQPVVQSRRQRNNHEDPQRTDSDGAIELVGIDSLSDVLVTRILYSGLRSDDLCRCAAVCRRWNRLVWNPLLWTCIDLTQAPDCDADVALRSDCTTKTSFKTCFRLTAFLIKARFPLPELTARVNGQS